MIARVCFRFLVVLILLSSARGASAVVINISVPTAPPPISIWHGQFGTPTTGTVGDDALLAVAIAAADYWESRIHDPVSIDIEVGFTNRRFGAVAVAVPYAFAGTGLIALDPRIPFFADPTPFDASEFPTEAVTFRDLGTGPLNTGIQYSGGTGAAGTSMDLFTILLHEVAHAIVFQITQEIDVGLPFGGTPIPTIGPHIDLREAVLDPNGGMTVPFFGQRTLPSDLDILATATWGGFTDVTLNQFAVAVDEPATVGLLLAGGVMLLVRRRRGFES